MLHLIYWFTVPNVYILAETVNGETETDYASAPVHISGSGQSSGCGDEELREALRAAIWAKPAAHRFDVPREITERHMMSQIGG